MPEEDTVQEDFPPQREGLWVRLEVMGKHTVENTLAVFLWPL